MKQLKAFVHHGQLKQGKLILDNPRYWKGMVMGFADAKVRIVLEKIRGTRTQKQNRYYWGVVLELIANHTGYLTEEVHEVMKSKFLRSKKVWGGGEITILRSTSDLTSDEFAEYIEQVRVEATEMEINIPDPDKNYYVKEEFGDELKDEHV